MLRRIEDASRSPPAEGFWQRLAEAGPDKEKGQGRQQIRAGFLLIWGLAWAWGLGMGLGLGLGAWGLAGLGSARLGSAGLGWAGLGWGWAGLGWAHLSLAAPCWPHQPPNWCGIAAM